MNQETMEQQQKKTNSTLFINIEGIDGIGKSTTVDMLIEKLESLGYKTGWIHFPRKYSEYGKKIYELLNTENHQLAECQYNEMDKLQIDDRIDYFTKNLKDIKDKYDVFIMDRGYYSGLIYRILHKSNYYDLDVDSIHKIILDTIQLDLIKTDLVNENFKLIELVTDKPMDIFTRMTKNRNTIDVHEQKETFLQVYNSYNDVYNAITHNLVNPDNISKYKSNSVTFAEINFKPVTDLYDKTIIEKFLKSERIFVTQIDRNSEVKFLSTDDITDLIIEKCNLK